MFLARGGRTGTHDDFVSPEVSNHACVTSMPYLSHLISEDGPFGLPSHAFVFDMRPGGVARVHFDYEEAW